MPTVFEEYPYVYVIATDKKAQVCHYCCLADAQTLRRCSGCRFAYYCNGNCQKNAWRDHREECAGIKKIFPRVPNHTARLIARILFKQQSGESDEAGGGCKRTFGMLMSHVSECKKDPLFMDHFACVLTQLKAYVGEDRLPSDSGLLEMFGKIYINSFTIVENEAYDVGIGLYLQLSALDHSCEPDAVVVFDGPKAILNCVNGAKECTEFTKLKTCYVDLLSPARDRKQNLKDKYFFECDCHRCCDGEKDKLLEAFVCSKPECQGAVTVSSIQDSNGACETCGTIMDVENGSLVMQEVKWKIEELKPLQSRGESTEVYEKSTALLKKADGILHSLNVHYIRLIHFAYEAAINLVTWPQAIDWGRKYIRSRRALDFRGHPVITYELAKVGKMLRCLGRLEEAEQCLQEALDEAAISHGVKHSLYNTITKLLVQCREERRSRLSREHHRQ